MRFIAALSLFYCFKLPFAMEQISSQNWKRTFVSLAEVSSSENATTFNAQSRLICASQAMNLEWPNAFCYDANLSVCLLTDVVLVPVERTSADQILCMTRFVIPEACQIEEGKALAVLNGQNREFPIYDFKKCIDGKFVFPYANECPSTFDQKENLGCVLLVKEFKDWPSARIYCLERGADLVTVDTVTRHNAFKDYLINQDSTLKNIWVGLIRKIKVNSESSFKYVLTNTTLPLKLWVQNTPDSMKHFPTCVRAIMNNNYLLNDIECSIQYNFICQLP